MRSRVGVTADLLVIPRHPLTVDLRGLTADSAMEGTQVPGPASTVGFQVLEFTICRPAELQVRNGLDSGLFPPGTSWFLPAIRLMANRTPLDDRSIPLRPKDRDLWAIGTKALTIARDSPTAGDTASLTGETVVTIAMISSLAALCCRGG